MRTLLHFCALLLMCTVLAEAQAPPYFNYQGLARDVDGSVLSNQDLSLRISILRDTPDGMVLYRERHHIVTNNYGVFTLKIGGGDLREGALNAVAWSTSTCWLQVEMDEHGGSDYTLLGASQLLSVPYAMHAAHADRADALIADDGKNSSSVTGGSNGSPWSTRGNEETDASLDFVGTADREDLAFRTDGIERMRLTAYGKLGIGVDEPASTFDVRGNATVGSTYAGNAIAPDNGLLVEGHVGIGEVNPVATLEVSGELVLGSTYTGWYMPPADGALIEGRVGIGTPSPGSHLGVAGGLSVGKKFAENAAPVDGASIEGKLGVGTTIPKSSVGVAGNVSIGSEYARSYEAPSEGLIVQGDVGIGTEAPMSTLGTAGNASIGSTYASAYKAPEDGLLVEGALGVGVPDPGAYKLKLLGNSYLEGNVEITANTLIGGTLDVHGVTTLHNPKDVDVIKKMGEKRPESFLGGLRCVGAVGIEKNLNIGNDLGVTRDAYVGHNLEVGGTATFKNLVVTNYADLGTMQDAKLDTLTNPTPHAPVTFVNTGEALLKEQVRITSELPADEIPLNKSSAEAIPPDDNEIPSGALLVYGGIGVAKNIMMGGQLTVDYSLQDPVAETDYHKYPARVMGGNQGLAVQLNVHATGDNNYIVFTDVEDNVVKCRGAIEGQTRNERINSWEYGMMTAKHALELTAASIVLYSDAHDYRVGVGFGSVTVFPGPSKVIASTIKLVALAAQIAWEQTNYLSHWGVAYTSQNGDYAEWLERADYAEELSFGEIVGVRGGKVSRHIGAGDIILVISRSPIVLGNVPPEGREGGYEKCAFLGQVPVRVRGPVSLGDYIIPSGNDDGIGVAVHPMELTVEQSGQIVGIAWDELPAQLTALVNVAVGMPVKSGTEVLQKQQRSIESLRDRVAVLESVMRSLVPDLDQRIAALNPGPTDAGSDSMRDQTAVTVAGIHPSAHAGSHESNITTDPDLPVANPTLVTEEMILQAIDAVYGQFRSQGIDPEDIGLLRKLKEDPSFRLTFLAAIRSIISTGGDHSMLDRVIVSGGQ